MLKKIPFLPVLLTLSGCMFYQPGFRYGVYPPAPQVKQDISGDYKLEAVNLTVNIPKGWFLDASIPTALVITKDRSNMRIGAYDTRSFHSDTSLDKRMKDFEHMKPEQIAKSLMDELKERESDVETLELIPVEFAGKPGWRITYSYDTKSWPAKKGVEYGCMVGPFLYHLIYESEFSLFAHDLPDVEKVKESFRLIK